MNEDAAKWGLAELGKDERARLCAAVLERGHDTEPYTEEVLEVVLSDASTFPTNVQRAIRLARELGLRVRKMGTP